MKFHRIDTSVPAGEARHFEIDGVHVAIVNVGGTLWAIEDLCTHARGRLSDGYLEGEVIECPLHFGKFNVRTGEAVSPPCKRPVRTFPVRSEADAIYVGLPVK